MQKIHFCLHLYVDLHDDFLKLVSKMVNTNSDVVSYLLPSSSCNLMINSSSSCVQLPRLIFGRRQFTHRSLQLFPVLDSPMNNLNQIYGVSKVYMAYFCYATPPKFIQYVRQIDFNIDDDYKGNKSRSSFKLVYLFKLIQLGKD